LCRFLDLGFPFFVFLSTSAEPSRCGGTAGAPSAAVAPSEAAVTADEVDAMGSLVSKLMTVTWLPSLSLFDSVFGIWKEN